MNGHILIPMVDEVASATAVQRVIEQVSTVYARWNRATSVEQMRRDWDELFGSQVIAAHVQEVSANGVVAAWVSAPGTATDRTLLYFHGGGFQVGSRRSHLDLMVHLSAAANCRVLAVEYRMAPEHRFPAALEDACQAYEWLLEQNIDSQKIAVAGDSAGGGLALSVLIKQRDRGRPLPASVVVLSAWTDLSASGESYQSRAAADPIHQRRMIIAMATNYLGAEVNPRAPAVSPLYADLHGLPPILLQVGDRETVLDDSRYFADKARASQVSVRLEVYAGMIHVFQQFPNQLPEARIAIESIGDFLHSNWRHELLL